jgi:hypothetical protein
MDFGVLSERDIVEIPITREMRAFAEEKAEKMGVLNKHSMMKGERNVEGILGELAALKFLPKAEATDTHDNDLKIGQVTIDVKTKRLTNKPRLYYDCTVYGYNPHQNCHVYLFAGVKSDYSVVWLSGFISKKEFYEKSEFCPAGSQRPLGGGKMLTYKEDNYVIQVNKLKNMKFLKNVVIKK